MNATRTEAEKCAMGLPTGFALLTLPVIIEIIETAFNVWKGCQGASAPKQILGLGIAANGDYKPRILRRAKRSMAYAAQQTGTYFNDQYLTDITTAALDHVYNADTTVVSACCSEQPSPVASAYKEDPLDATESD